MKKKVLIYAHYFYPDVASTGQLLTELCNGIKDKFDITVICVVPSYDGKVNDKYKKQRIFREEYNGIKLVRVRVCEFDKGNKKSRVKNILGYFFNSIIATFKVDKPDVIFTISQPPVLGGLLGVVGKLIKGGKLIYNIQDFNPEQIEAVSYSDKKSIIKLMRILDNLSIRFSKKVLVVGNDQLDTLENRKEKFKEKGIIINNWINEKEIYPLDKDNLGIVELKKKYVLEDKFIVMYSGNLGLYYDLENLMKIAQNFENINDLVFVFAGDGAIKEELQSIKEKYNLGNVRFLPYQPKEKLNLSLNIADVHLVVNAKGIKGVSIPSKVYGVLASGKYSIGVLEKGSEARILIESANCGKCVEPKDYNGFKELILEAYENRERVNEIGMQGRKFLEENLTIDIAMNKYEELLNTVTK